MADFMNSPSGTGARGGPGRSWGRAVQEGDPRVLKTSRGVLE